MIPTSAGVDRAAPPPHPTDIPDRSWIDAVPLAVARPYLRLMRLDRPIGVWLLVFPCWWSVCLAGIANDNPMPDLWLMVLFLVGAVVMRGCGCAYNDYVDRDIDAKVARTATRPIPSGAVTPSQALAFAIILGWVGFVVLIQFNWVTIAVGTGSLVFVAIYPFMKRLTDWPQLVLGIAFNWGALVGWTAVNASLDWPPVLLFLGSVMWTVGYDTIYAHQDREDDRALGLKSTALRFGARTRIWVGGFYAAAVLLWLAAGMLSGTHIAYGVAVGLVAAHLVWQVATLDMSDAKNCLHRFRANRDVGILLLLGLIADMLLSSSAGSG